MQCESRERAIGALKWMEITHDPRMSRQTAKYGFSKYVEVHVCEFIALGTIGASSCACATVGFAEKQHNLALGSRSDRISPQRGTISANGEIST